MNRAKFASLVSLFLFVCGCNNTQQYDVNDVPEYMTPVPTVKEAKKNEQIVDTLQLPERTGFYDLFNALGLEAGMQNKEYIYVCEDDTEISCEMYHTSELYLEKYINDIQLEKAEKSEEQREKFCIRANTEVQTYQINISDNMVIVYKKQDGSLNEIGAYSYIDRTIDMADVRSIIFRPTQLDEYVKKAVAISLFDYGLVEANTKYSVDLDGNGTVEELYLGYCGSEWNDKWGEKPTQVYDGGYITGEYIYINGELLYSCEYPQHPCTQYFGITKLFSQNEKIHLITYEEGMGQYPTSRIYQYEENEITLLGEVPDCLFSKSLFEMEKVQYPVFDGLNVEKIDKECISYITFISFVQMWEVTGKAILSDAGKMKFVDIVYRPVSEKPMKLVYNVNAAIEMSEKAERGFIEAGSIYMDNTDGISWVHIVRADSGESGWIKIDCINDFLAETRTYEVSYSELFQGRYDAD